MSSESNQKDNNMPSTTNMNSSQSPKTKSPVKLILIVVGVIFLILLLVFAFTGKNSKITRPTINVSITSAGFNPSSLVITKGSTVKWTNTDTSPHRVAANPYPTHSDLPSLDSKTNLGANATYSYTFNNTGTVNYHDELYPSHNGSIVVR